MKKESFIKDKVFLKQLWILLFPIAIQQFLSAFVAMTDVLMIGHVSQTALSAVSFATQVNFILNIFVAGMTAGVSVFEAQFWGKRDIRSLEVYFAYGMKFTAYVSFFFFLASFLFPEMIMRIYTPDPVLIQEGASYLRIVAPSYFFMSISQIYLCTLKNSGLAHRSTVISAMSVFTNIFLNAVLIYGLLGMPAMGVRGAALATTIARTLELLLAIVESKKSEVRLCFSNMRKKVKLVRKQFWKYTMPLLANSVSWGIAYSMYSVIMGHLGTDAIAANSVTYIVKNLVSSLMFGLGGGASIMIGNLLGAGLLDKAKDYGHKLMHTAFWIGILSGLACVLLVPITLRVTSLSPQASHYLRWMLVMCTYNALGQAINVVTYNGIFTAGGDGKFGFICDMITMYGVILPLGFLSAFVFKAPVLVVFFLLYLDEVIKIPAVLWNYKRYNWIKDLTV